MKIFNLSDAQKAGFDYTHRFEITYTDLTALGAVTSGTVSLAEYVAGKGITGGAFKLVTNFDGGATSALALDVGWDGATTDDADGVLDNYEIHEDATEVKFGDANGAAFATLRTGYFPLDAGAYKATFTATGGNLNALTQGEVHIYLRICDLTAV